MIIEWLQQIKILLEFELVEINPRMGVAGWKWEVMLGCLSTREFDDGVKMGERIGRKVGSKKLIYVHLLID